MVVLVELIPGVSPLTPIASIFPLVFVVTVTAIKDAYEDIVPLRFFFCQASFIAMEIRLF